MQTYELTLTSQPSNSFRCMKAANSVDLDLEKKLTHKFKVTADMETPFNIGLIVGASGSGKTTFAKKVFGEEVFKELLDISKPIIEQFPEKFSYDDCANALNAAGLSQVPCWLRPASTLSNGQKARAEIALQLAFDKEIIVIDEFTSVVDRTIAKIMSNTVQKQARKTNKKIILLACHYDIIDWLNPDWIIDCNVQEYKERRHLVKEFQRTEKLEFSVKECSSKSWKYFSKYHYLSENLPGGFIKTYGLFEGDKQIGFQCFAEYTPWTDKKKKRILHSNRTVLHPDYVGLGLVLKLINITSDLLCEDYKIMAKYSSLPVYKAMCKNSNWKLINTGIDTKISGSINSSRKNTVRKKVKWWSFEYARQK